MEDDFIFLRLRCKDCEQDLCAFQPNKTIIKNLEGCTRKVSEETAARFHHYMKEVIPFWKQHDESYVRQSYKEIIEFLFSQIYSAPIGQRLDSNGKVKGSVKK